MNDQQAFQITITLDNSDPLVWRTLAIPKDATLDELHQCIQILFGWMDIHDYYFEQVRNEQKYAFFIDDDFSGEEKTMSSSQTVLSGCFVIGEQWKYVYDVDHCWSHDIQIIGEVKLHSAGEPELIAWEQDNLAENADSDPIDFDEKRAILRQPKHPQYPQMREWWEKHHQSFDEKTVKHLLAALHYERIALSPVMMLADMCESLFTITERETLIRVRLHHEYYDVLFVDHEDERNIQIFRKEADFLDSYLASYDCASIHPLYQNGYVLHFPNFGDMSIEELPEELWEPQLLYYQSGKGEHSVDQDEFDELFNLIDFLNHMQGIWEKHLGSLPDLQESMILSVVREPNHVRSQFVTYYPDLPKSRMRLGKKDQEQLAQGKHSKERLQMNLLPIPDLMSADNDYTFYISATGKRTGFLHRLHAKEKRAAMKEIREQFVTYMKEYGVPMEVSVEDRHLYRMLEQLCKDLSVTVLWQESDQAAVAEQFEEAMQEQNPTEELDQELLASLAHLSEAELIAYLDKQPEDKMKKILKQLLYMSMFNKE